MSEVSINQEKLPELIQLCTRVENELNSTIKKIDNANNNVAKEWKDGKYKEFQGIIIDSKSLIIKTNQEIERCKRYLLNLLTVIQEYDSIQFTGTRSGGNVRQAETYNNVYNSWGNEILSRINGQEQMDIYLRANLHEGVVNGRRCLMKEIDMDFIDEKTGLTNRERMARGLSPFDAVSGERIELHHMGQDFDSPFAELNENSEHGDGNHSILHTSGRPSFRQDNSQLLAYQRQRREYWRTRSLEQC